MKNALTTFEAAKYCNTNMISISRWIRDGELKSYKTPGGHNRIMKEDLFRFMEKFNIPIPEKLGSIRKKVLIASDDVEVQEQLFSFLSDSHYNFDVTVAGDGYEAGIKLVRFKPDILILDLMMPYIDGFDVCEEIKIDPVTQNIKILILSVSDNPAAVKKAYEKGADKVLFKPAAANELLKEINVLLRKNY